MKRWLPMGLFVLTLGLVLTMGVPQLQAADAVAGAKYEAAGNQLYKSGDFAKAVQYYQAAIQMDPSKTASYVGLGNSQYRLGRKDEALAAYDKALALDPSNAQLTQFVNNLRGTTLAPAPASGNTLDNPLKQGTDLFAQKRYAEAIPLFEQAAVKDPGNPNIQYYLAYACAMTQDNRGAALHFYKFNAMSPNPGVLAYADKLKASLPPLDQRWVEDQLAGRTNVARRTHMPFKKRGLRLIPALYLPSQNSMKSYAESVTAMVAAAQVYDPSMAANISLPTGFLEIQLQPCYELSPNFEFALSLNYASVGSLKTSLTSDVSYNYNSDIKFTEVGIGILGRYFFGRPEKKLRPFLGAGVLFAAAKSEGTYSYSYVDTPEYNYSVTGSSNAAGIGGQFELGVDFCPSPYFHMGPIVGYRFLKATKFGDSADSLDLDMGGPMAGIMLSAFY